MLIFSLLFGVLPPAFQVVVHARVIQGLYKGYAGVIQGL